MAGKPTKIKKKKSVLLAARDVRVVDGDEGASGDNKTRIVITSTGKSGVKRIRRTGPGTVSTRPRTQRIDASQSISAPSENSLTATPVDMDDPDMKADMENDPLPPPEDLKPTEGSGVPDKVRADGEPTFKFFCYRCGQKLMVPISWANNMYPCGRCGHDITIPPPMVGNVWK